MKIFARALIPVLLTALLAFPALAEKGGKHGHGRGNDHSYDDDRGHGREDRQRGGDTRLFDDNFRITISSYYGQESRGGRCPPGLAKKGNGCMPPGQAKKWRRGHALPHDLARYPLPYDLLRRLPAPPRGHEYVRVAGDILMIAVGTALVVDALEDLVR